MTLSALPNNKKKKVKSGKFCVSFVRTYFVNDFYPDSGLFVIIVAERIKRSPDLAKVCKILLPFP